MSGIVGSAGSKSGVIGTTELDYETGTFSPGISGTGSGGNYGHSTTKGTYVKIGKCVTFNIEIAMASHADGGNGDARISSLPFAVSYCDAGQGIGFAGSWDAPEPDAWRAAPSATAITLTRHDTNGYWYNYAASYLANNSYIELSGSYICV